MNSEQTACGPYLITLTSLANELPFYLARHLSYAHLATQHTTNPHVQLAPPFTFLMLALGPISQSLLSTQ